MTFKELQDYARQLLRDINKTIFQEVEISRTINEGIDRMRSVKELRKMTKLESPDDIPEYVPDEYHHLLSLFSASRCFFQDEQFQQATMLMNEFESKFFELKEGIENGDIVITDKDGNVENSGENQIDYIKDVYFKRVETIDID